MHGTRWYEFGQEPICHATTQTASFFGVYEPTLHIPMTFSQYSPSFLHFAGLPPMTTTFLRPTAVAALALLAPGMLAAQAPSTPRPMELRDWYRVHTVSQPAMSPDGKLVAFTVTTARESENKRHQEVWVVPTAGGEPMRYTSPSTESSNPRFTPDGKYLQFNSTRPGGRGNTWVLRMDAPGGEASQLENIPSGSMPANGAFAIFSEPATRDSAVPRANDPYARMQAPARPPMTSITRPTDPARFDGRQYVEMPIKSNGVCLLYTSPSPRD